MAIRTDGLLVVDIDGPENQWLADDPDKAASLAAGVLALTPRGGRHYWFKQPAGANLSKTEGRLSPKVDTRANDSYALVAPSVVQGKPYRWPEDELPERDRLPLPPQWLIDALTEPKPRAESPQAGNDEIPSGQRNSTLTSIAGSLRRIGLEYPAIKSALDVINITRCKPPLPPSDVERIARSVSGYEFDQFAKAAAEGANEPPPHQSFPFDVFPPAICNFICEAAASIGCDESYVGVPAISVLATAIGSTRRIAPKTDWQEPANFWGVLTGESGTAKSPAMKLALRPIKEREIAAAKQHEAAIKEYLRAAAVHVKAMKAWEKSKSTDLPPIEPEASTRTRYYVSDVTAEAFAPILKENPRGVLLVRDEFAAFFGSLDRYAKNTGSVGADSSNWLQLHSAETVSIDRKTGQPRSILVPNPAVFIAGGIQPGTLKRALTRQHRDSGLAARFLFAYPPRKAKRWSDASIDPATNAGYEKVVASLYALHPGRDADGQPMPIVLPLTPDGKREWIRFCGEHSDETQQLAEDLAAVWSKLEAAAARLALIVHCTREAAADPTLASAAEVDIESVKAGITLARWFGNEAKRIYAMLDAPEGAAGRPITGDEIDDIVSLANSPEFGGKLSVTKLQNKRSRYRGDVKAIAAFERVEAANRGRIVRESTGGPQGTYLLTNECIVTPIFDTTIPDPSISLAV